MVLINGKEFGAEKFSNMESVFTRAACKKGDTTVVISLIWESDADLGVLAIARNHVADILGSHEHCYLMMLYVPYSRMDREIGDQICSLLYFSQFINSLRFSGVYKLDPHSEMCDRLFENGREIKLEPYVERAATDFEPDVIMFPDKGAFEKYSLKLPHMCKKYTVVRGEKVRDLNNKGSILSYKILDAAGSAADIIGKRVLIIDDIVVYGGTVKHAAAELRKLGASAVSFWVTHLENAAFEGKIFEQLARVYTTTSLIKNGSADKLTEYTVLPPDPMF